MVPTGGVEPPYPRYERGTLPLCYVGMVAGPGLEPDFTVYETVQTTWPSLPRSFSFWWVRQELNLILAVKSGVLDP